jgi:tetratricopeptide (TPR) repeat protein
VCGLLALGVSADRGRQAAAPSMPATLQEAAEDHPPVWATRSRFAPLIATPLVFFVLLGPRWASGVYLNVGSADVVAAALDQQRNAESRSERLARAERWLEAAVGWNGNNVAAYRNLGWARVMRHDIPGAHAAIAAADRPDVTPFERAQLARLTREAGLIDRAIGLLKQGGDEVQLRDVAAQVWEQRRWRDAAAAYAALTELNPDESEYISNTAIAVLNDGGDAEAAMSLLSDAVAKNPDAARNLARQLVLRGEPCRADERRGGGRFECAAFWFALASRVDPTYDRPEVELGSIHYYRGRYEEAAAHFSEASRRDPQNPSTYSQLCPVGPP